MPRKSTNTGGKPKGQWRPPAPDQGKPFAEVNLDGGKDAISRSSEDDHDEELPPTEDGDEETPEERRTFDRSKSMKRRIVRLERSFSQRIADQEAKYQREIADLRRQNDSLRVSRNNTGPDQAAHEAKIAA